VSIGDDRPHWAAPGTRAGELSTIAAALSTHRGRGGGEQRRFSKQAAPARPSTLRLARALVVPRGDPAIRFTAAGLIRAK